MLVPLMVTVPPPAMTPVAGLAVTPLGAVGSVPPDAVESVAGSPSADDTVVGEVVWTNVDATLAPVTIATTVSVGRAVPLVKEEPLVVQVMVCPTGDWQIQPVP
jgi:hypothetical protein